MADSSIAITAGSGTLVDTRTIGSDHRQVLVVGDETASTCAPVDTAGLHARPGKAAAATLTNVAASVTSVTLLAANTARLGAVIVNDSTSIVYIKYGTTASATSLTYIIPPNTTWEMDHGVIYTGIITGIWLSATGNARMTELT